MSLLSSDRATDIELCIASIFATLPLAIACIPWGVLTGALAIDIGLSPWQAQAMSLLVFAGAAQLSALTMFAGGASTLAVFGSTFAISSRHLLYSIVFRQRMLQLSQGWRVLIAFVLTDEMFAVSEAHTRETGRFSALYAFASGMCFYVVWNLATLIGVVVGDSIEDLDSLGLDFAIAATFIAMTFGDLRHRPIFATMLISGVLSILLKPILPDGYIVVAALAGMCVGYYLSEDSSEEE